MANIFLFVFPKSQFSKSQLKELAKLYFDLGKLSLASAVLEPLLNKKLDILLFAVIASGLVSAIYFFSKGLSFLKEVDKFYD